MLFAIGDVHGHFDKLAALIGHCRAHASGCGESARFVLLGDYIDRGPASREVIAFLASGPEGVQAIRGNHEQMMLQALDDPAMEAVWHRNGGRHTLASYGVRNVRKLPADHLDLVRSLPLYVDDGIRLFVHAGIDPSDPAARDPDVLLWTRKHPSDDIELPRFVVHGHTPTFDRRPDLRPSRLNLDTGAGYGYALTAAIFQEDTRSPWGFMDHAGEAVRAPPPIRLTP